MAIPRGWYVTQKDDVNTKNVECSIKIYTNEIAANLMLTSSEEKKQVNHCRLPVFFASVRKNADRFYSDNSRFCFFL